MDSLWGYEQKELMKIGGGVIIASLLIGGLLFVGLSAFETEPTHATASAEYDVENETLKVTAEEMNDANEIKLMLTTENGREQVGTLSSTGETVEVTEFAGDDSVVAQSVAGGGTEAVASYHISYENGQIVVSDALSTPDSETEETENTDSTDGDN